jgi:methylated-DNA-[protein]-cysteine S-methyltransferase
MEKHLPKELTTFQQKVFELILKVPAGKVTTYNEIARILGNPGAVRAVGNALHINPNAPETPCHRVVRANGELGGYALGSVKKAGLLKKEGITIINGKIPDLPKYLFKF